MPSEIVEGAGGTFQLASFCCSVRTEVVPQLFTEMAAQWRPKKCHCRKSPLIGRSRWGQIANTDGFMHPPKRLQMNLFTTGVVEIYFRL